MTKDAGIGRPQERPTRTSDLLRLFAQSVRTDRVSLGEIVDALGDRGLGVLIAVFALPNILPFVVPFGNVLFGLAVAIFAFHLTLDVHHLVLPRFLARRTMSATTFKAWAPRVAGSLFRVERFLKPRLPAVTLPGPERMIGIICILLAVVCALPISFAHNLPAVGLTLIGLGLIERDGAAIIAGITVGVAGVILLVLVLFGLAYGLERFATWL